jgi:hypothetical protein
MNNVSPSGTVPQLSESSGTYNTIDIATTWTIEEFWDHDVTQYHLDINIMFGLMLILVKISST